jgi:hypothetical protein
MGAALVLDSPSPEYVSRYVKKINKLPGFGTFPELDRVDLNKPRRLFNRSAGREPSNLQRRLRSWNRQTSSGGDYVPSCYGATRCIPMVILLLPQIGLKS